MPIYRNLMLVFLSWSFAIFSPPTFAFSLSQLWDKFSGDEFSPQYVAKGLTKGAATDEEKAQRIFYWMTDNLTYDVQSYRSGQFKDQTTEEMMRSKTGICEDYAILFNEMAIAAGLKSTVVKGYVSGVIGANETVGHAWNVVEIAGSPKVVDVTWGSGQYDSATGIFTAKRDLRFFLADPEHVLLTHREEDQTGRAIDLPGFTFEQFKQVTTNVRRLAKLGVPPRHLITTLGTPAEFGLPTAEEPADLQLSIVHAPLHRPVSGVLTKYEFKHSPGTRIFLRSPKGDTPFNTNGLGLSWLEQPAEISEIRLVYKIENGGYFELIRYPAE